MRTITLMLFLPAPGSSAFAAARLPETSLAGAARASRQAGAGESPATDT